MKPIVKILNALIPVSQHGHIQLQVKWTSLVLPVFLFFILSLTSCAKVDQGKVVGFGQSMSGMVQSFVMVELSDGSEVRAWLPMDDDLWDEMSSAAENSERSDVIVEIKFNKSENYWDYVKVVPKE